MQTIQFISKGRIAYRESLDFQNRLFEQKIQQKKNGQLPENHIIWCEHPHVYTLGNSGDRNNLLVNDEFLKSINATYFKSNRGGDITYHGPGQLVGYPIIDLKQFDLGVKDYVYVLEQSITELIARYGLKGQIKKGAAGVWLDVGSPNERKICAVGVKVSRGITMHGFALNVTTDLSYFNHINPCGFTDKGATSLEKETGKAYTLDELCGQLEVILPENLKAFKWYAKHFA